MTKPKPRYGWWGQVLDDRYGGVTVGSRVYHHNAPESLGTVLSGPHLKHPLVCSPYEVWMIEWDACLGKVLAHMVETISLVK